MSLNLYPKPGKLIKRARIQVKQEEPEDEDYDEVMLVRAEVDHKLIPVSYPTLRRMGYVLASHKQDGIGNRINSYLVIHASDKKLMQQTHLRVLNDYPDFIRIYYERIGTSRAIFYVKQKEASGKLILIDKSSTPQKINT